MNIFNCDACGTLVFFENVSCLSCGHTLGFLPDIMDLATLEPHDQEWKSLSAAASGRLYRARANGRHHAVCNWFVPVDEPDEFCAACRLNAVVPDVTLPKNHAAWHKPVADGVIPAVGAGAIEPPRGCRAQAFPLLILRLQRGQVQDVGQKAKRVAAFQAGNVFKENERPAMIAVEKFHGP